MRTYTIDGVEHRIEESNTISLVKLAVEVAGGMAALAERIGVSRGTVYAWYYGKSNPHGDNVHALHEVIGGAQ